MELTKYQKDIIKFFKDNPNKNIYINAKAGCGKSFIAVQMLKDVSLNSVYLAFNKSIAEEMKEKLDNPKVKIYTMHGLCNSILNYNLAKDTPQAVGIGKQRSENNTGKLDYYKIPNLIEDLLLTNQKARKDYEYKDFLKENYTKLYNLIRLKAIEMDSITIKASIHDIIREQGLFFHEDYDTPNIEDVLTLCKRLHNRSLELFEEEKIYDFTDMLYITFLKLSNKEWEVPYWHLYSNVVNDELQDYSTIQLLLLRFFKRANGRYVFILDPRQAIYLFSGANSNSFKLVKSLYAPVMEFDLPINYRCASSHLDYVNRLYNIGIKANNKAPKGHIYDLTLEEMLDTIKPGDYLIGRKNKWLMPCILELIKRGKPVYIKDENFVKSVKKVVSNCNFDSIVEVENKIKNKQKRLQQKIKYEKNNETTEEKAIVSEEHEGQMECLNTIILLLNSFKQKYSTKSKNQFLKYIDGILNTEKSTNCIFVSSIHCVKGLEANNVFILNKAVPPIDKRMTREQRQQEYNLSYVALTRAKENLYLVSLEKEEDEEDYD